MDSPSTSATQSADEDDENINIHHENDVKVISSVNINPLITPQPSICKSSTGTCVLIALNGFDYCHKHILEDQQSPYQQCTFLSKVDMLRCCNPIPKQGN